MGRVHVTSILILSVFLSYACTKKETKPVFGLPVITTTAVTEITYTTAASGGNVTNEGGAPIISSGVCWNTSANPTTSQSKTVESGGTVTFTSTLSALTPNTKYYIRAYATNSAGTAYGTELSFTTNQVAVPVISTTAITQITQTSAASGGNVTSDNGGLITSKGVCWGIAANPSIANSKTSDGTGSGIYASIISGLTAGTTYYARAYATNSAGTTYGNELTFTTSEPVVVASATTTAATLVTQTGAILNGTVNANNQTASITFEYGLTTSYGQSVYATPNTLSNNITTNVSANLAGLTLNTTYHYRVKSVSLSGTLYGSDMTFTTSGSGLAPTVTTTAATVITQTGATLNGTVNANGQSTVISLEYGTTTSYGLNVNAIPNTLSNSTVTNVSAVLTGFTAGTTYHYRVKAISLGGTVYGNDISFTTSVGILPPTATTSSATSVTKTGATLNGIVNANNQSSTVTFEYGTTTSYGLNISAIPGTITGSTNTNVSATLTGLNASTIFHYRIKAVSTGGTSYGSDLTFTTTSKGAN